MPTDSIRALREEVERVFRKKILSYSDCVQLAEELQSKTGQRLNVNTLRRCFGIVTSRFNPSSSTLNMLAMYCGFTSFDHFSKNYNNKELNKEQSHILSEYLTYLMQTVPFENHEDITYVNTVRNTIIFLERCPEAIDAFQRGMAKTRPGQELYFEQFINVDRLNGYYGNGLRYYLSEKKTPEAQVFGNALLIWRYWLTDNGEELQNHYKALKAFSLTPGMPESAAARYFQGQVLWCEYMKKPLGNLISEARSYFTGQVSHKKALPFFEVLLANALLLVRQADEALFYIKQGRARWKVAGSKFYNNQIFYAFNLFEAIAHAMLGDNKKSLAVLESLNKTEFFFLARQYHSILHLVTLRKLGRLNGKKEELDFLFEQTGFSRLDRLFG